MKHGCLKSLIKMARMTSCDDSGLLRRGVLTWQGKQGVNGLVMTPYGHLSYPPNDSLAVVLSQNGQESNPIAIVDDPNNRPKLDAAGESGTANYLTGNSIIHKANGNTEGTANNSYVFDAGTSFIVRVGGVTFTIDSTGVNVSGGIITGNGGMSISGGSGVSISGDVNQTGGDYTTDGDVVAQSISLLLHLHGGVTAGAANTGVPI